MGKTIFVLLDACQFVGGTVNLGYLEHMAEYKMCARYKVKGELPSLSRPMYETLMTGLPVYRHGVTHNDCVRRSDKENIFYLCKKNGLRSGAAAYFWMSELYNHAPFDRVKDRIRMEKEGLIDYGIYYWEDIYPDTHLFADGEYIRKTYAPDFMVYHSMGIDEWGHIKGSESKEYLGAIAAIGEILSIYIPQWLDEGYEIVVTADHGMNPLGMHGGTDSVQRDTPLYIFSDKILKGRFDEAYISQLNIAPLLCHLLEIPLSDAMIQPNEIRGLL